MARWEYCRISWEARSETPEAQDVQARVRGGGASEQLDPGQRGGQMGLLERMGSDAPAKPIRQLDSTIAQLGRDGWELVSHVQLHDPVPVQHWYFKRLLIDITRTEF